jgi:signal transduction histidine kinase
MLTATVSHEMKTPLNSILGLLSAIEYFIPDPKGLKLLKMVSNSAHMLSYLIDDMIDLFSIRNGKFTRTNNTVSLI